MVQDLKNYIPPLEEKIFKSREEGEAQARSYFAMTHKVNYDHQQQVLQHRQQVLTGQKGRIEYYKRQLQEAQEKVRTMAHLRQALEMNGHNICKHKEWGRSATSQCYNPASRQAKKH